MNKFILFIFLFTWSSISFDQSGPFMHASVGATLTYRDLVVNELAIGDGAGYLSTRREIEGMRIRESVFAGIGYGFKNRFTIRTGMDYKRLGESEKVDIITLFSTTGAIGYDEYRFRHNYVFLGFPLRCDLDVFDKDVFDLGVSIQGKYAVLLEDFTLEPDLSDIAGNWAVYPDFLTSKSQSAFELGSGVYYRIKRSDFFNIEVGLDFSYQVTTSLVRETTVDQHNYYFGLSLVVLLDP